MLMVVCVKVLLNLNAMMQCMWGKHDERGRNGSRVWFFLIFANGQCTEYAVLH